MLGNLSAVKVLDLSHNELTQLSDKVLGPPHNLTELYIQGNLLPILPLKKLVSLKSQITMLDVRDNKLQYFHHELMPLVENGTRIFYSGK